MNSLNQILIAALALQLVVAGGIYIASQPPAADDIRAPLLASDVNEIDQVTIVDEDGKQAVLSKSANQWRLPDYHGLPANSVKVKNTLDALTASKSGWPVATTESGHERFKVLDDEFHKKLILDNAGDTVQTLYLGTSPGYRQVHVRRADEDDVFAVKLNSYEFSSDHEQWLDKSLLQPQGEIKNLQGPDYSFTMVDGVWKTSEDGKGEVVAEELAKITGMLARISVNSAENKPATSVDYELTAKTADNILTYRFFKDGDNHYITRDDYIQAFRINQTDYEKITGLTAAQLVRVEPAEGKSSEGEAEKLSDTGDLQTESNLQEEVMREQDS